MYISLFLVPSFFPFHQNHLRNIEIENKLNVKMEARFDFTNTIYVSDDNLNSKCEISLI